MGLIDRIWDSLFGRAKEEAAPSSTEGGGVATMNAPPQTDITAGPDVSHPADGQETTPWWSPEGVANVDVLWMEPVELNGEARALEALLVSHFDGHDLTMPPMPHIAERVLAALRNPSCSMGDVAHILSEDQVTAASVLRLANSPMYRGAYKITTLQTAVTRLGAQVLRTLMLHQSLRSATFPKSVEFQDLAWIIWRRSLASACIMRELAPLVGMDPEDAFMLGLLHDIGNVIVLRTVSEQESVSHHHIDHHTFEYLCYETHQEFGELVAESWQLPETIAAVVASHHAPPDDEDPVARERWLTLLTDMMSQMLGYAPPRAYDLLASAPARALGLPDHPQTCDILRVLPDRIEETLAHLE